MVETNFCQSNGFYQNQKWSEVLRNVVEDVVHREDVELPAVRQVEEEAFKEVVPGAQVEEDQEADLEAEGVGVDLEVVAVAVVVAVDLVAVGDVEAGISERHSAASSKNLSLYCNLFLFPVHLTRWQTKWRNTKSDK